MRRFTARRIMNMPPYLISSLSPIRPFPGKYPTKIMIFNIVKTVYIGKPSPRILRKFADGSYNFIEFDRGGRVLGSNEEKDSLAAFYYFAERVPRGLRDRSKFLLIKVGRHRIYCRVHFAKLTHRSRIDHLRYKIRSYIPYPIRREVWLGKAQNL